MALVAALDGVVFEVDPAGQRDAVVRPLAAVGEEESGLLGAGRLVRVREVVRAGDVVGGAGGGPVAGEDLVDDGGGFGGFEDGEAGAGEVLGLEVDGGLVVGDVEALNGGGALLGEVVGLCGGSGECGERKSEEREN